MYTDQNFQKASMYKVEELLEGLSCFAGFDEIQKLELIAYMYSLIQIVPLKKFYVTEEDTDRKIGLFCLPMLRRIFYALLEWKNVNTPAIDVEVLADYLNEIWPKRKCLKFFTEIDSDCKFLSLAVDNYLYLNYKHYQTPIYDKREN